MTAIELRCGDWRDVLADVGEVDTLISDPPFSEQVHGGNHEDRESLPYPPWSIVDVNAFVADWSPRVRGWMVVITDDVLANAYRAAYERAGRCAFALIPIIQHAPRLQGDGPGCCAVYAMVARWRTQKAMQWRSTPGWYKSERERNGIVRGAKPMPVMRALVRDYSRPGDLVCDPCAGGATTLIAAATEGRRAIGAELDPSTFAKATKRIAKGYTPTLFDTSRAAPAEQAGLFDGDKGSM